MEVGEVTDLDDVLRQFRAGNSEVFNVGILSANLVPVSFGGYEAHGGDPPVMLGDYLLPRVDGRAYWGVYLTTDEYLEGPRGESAKEVRAAVVDLVLKGVDQGNLLIMLRNLDAALGVPERQAEIQAFLETQLPPRERARLQVALADENRALYSVQGVLAAFRRCIVDGKQLDQSRIDPRLGAILLVQSALEGDDDEATSGRQLGGFPEETAMSIIANHAFNATTNVYAEFDRALRIFADPDGTFTKKFKGHSPRDLVKAATGLDIETLMTCAMVLWAIDQEKDLWGGRGLNKRVNETMDEANATQFWAVCSRSVSEFRPILSSQMSEWDYFSFEKFPILDFGGAVLAVSRHLLLERVTTGLYHFVYEYLEANDSELLEKWKSEWGFMVEAVVVESLRTLAPPLLGPGTSFFSEADITSAYPQGKKCDALIDFGDTVLAIEIVSSPLSRESRQGLDVAKLRDDMERIVFRKTRQLSATAMNVARRPELLLGEGRSPVRIVPLLIAAGGFPVNPVTLNLIREQVSAEGLFGHALIGEICVISAEEAEYLEALREQGHNPIEVLADWRAAGPIIGNYSLKNWLTTSDRFPTLRPARMKAPVSELFKKIRNAVQSEVAD